MHRPKLDRKQVEVTEPNKLITAVIKPNITVHRPAKDKDTGTGANDAMPGVRTNAHPHSSLNSLSRPLR